MLWLRRSALRGRLWELSNDMGVAVAVAWCAGQLPGASKRQVKRMCSQLSVLHDLTDRSVLPLLAES